LWLLAAAGVLGCAWLVRLLIVAISGPGSGG
jgi:hypothetical protein